MLKSIKKYNHFNQPLLVYAQIIVREEENTCEIEKKYIVDLLRLIVDILKPIQLTTRLHSRRQVLTLDTRYIARNNFTHCYAPGSRCITKLQVWSFVFDRIDGSERNGVA